MSTEHFHDVSAGGKCLVKMTSVSSEKTFVTGQCKLVVVSLLQMSPPPSTTSPSYSLSSSFHRHEDPPASLNSVVMAGPVGDVDSFARKIIVVSLLPKSPPLFLSSPSYSRFLVVMCSHPRKPTSFAELCCHARPSSVHPLTQDFSS